MAFQQKIVDNNYITITKSGYVLLPYEFQMSLHVVSARAKDTQWSTVAQYTVSC